MAIKHMWYNNVIMRMIREGHQLSEFQNDMLTAYFKKKALKYENKTYGDNTQRRRLLDMAAICYLLDQINRRLKCEDLTFIKIVNLYLVCFITAIKIANDIEIGISDIVEKDKVSTYNAYEIEHLKALNFELEISDDRIDALFEYLTFDEKHILWEQLEGHYQSDLFKVKLKKAIASELSNHCHKKTSIDHTNNNLSFFPQKSISKTDDVVLPAQSRGVANR